jgi:hypothetical protein
MGFLKRYQPYVILGAALLLFVFPVMMNRTLTNFSDIYAMSPWNGHQPAGWFHSNSIDASPSYFFNPSDLLNRELLREGTAFSWNPYVGFGTPWLGVMQGAPYFPGKLISMFWPDYWKGQDVMLIVLLLTAGIGNYLLLRSVGVTREGATFSGLAYMLCQRLFLVINMPSFTIECLLPLLLYAVNEMVKRKSLGFALFAGAIGGAQFLGGFPEASFMLGLISGLFFLWLLIQDYRSTGAWKRGVWLALITAVVAVALSGFQLAEFAKFVVVSHHSHSTNYGTVVKQPFWLLPMFLPNFFGTPLESFWISQISPYDHMPPSLFCGISTVLLATMALLWRAAPNRNYVWFFAALFFVFVGYDYGFPILKYVGHLPFINMMSTAWNAFVIPFALSVLAGFGVQSLRQPGSVARLGIAFAVYVLALVTLLLMVPVPTLSPSWRSFVPLIYVVPLFVAAFFLIRRWQWLRIGACLLFALITLESYLCVQAFGYLHYYGPKPPELPSLTWLTRNHDRIFGVDAVYSANTLNPWRIRDIRHLDAMYSKLYVDYADAIWPGAQGDVYQISNPKWKNVRDPLLDLAAVKYVITSKPLQTVPAGLTEVYSDRDATIYRSASAFARAHFASNVLTLSEGFAPSALKGLIEELKTGVVLEGYSGERRTAACETAAVSPVEFLEDDVSQVRLRVIAPCAGFLVLADLFYPGWTASVDGKKVSIYKANYAFRAVEIGPGTHEVLFSYDPWATRLGVPIALLTVFGLGYLTYKKRPTKWLREVASTGANAKLFADPVD